MEIPLETLQANRELLWDMGKSIAEKDAQLKRLKTLLVRAADALEFPFHSSRVPTLISELRKAAQ
jgi:hypothetical protein